MAGERTNIVPESMSVEIPGFREAQAKWNETWRRAEGREKAIAADRAAWMRSQLRDQSAQARLMSDLNPLVVAGEIYAGEVAAAGLKGLGRLAFSGKMRPGFIRVPRGMKRVTAEEIAAADREVMSPVSARDIELSDAAARTIWNRGTGHAVYEFVDKNLSRVARIGEWASDHTVMGAYEKGVERSVKFLAKKLWPGGVTDSTLAGRPFGYAVASVTGAGTVVATKLGLDKIYDKWLREGKATRAGAPVGAGDAMAAEQRAEQTNSVPVRTQQDARITLHSFERALRDFRETGDTNAVDAVIDRAQADTNVWPIVRAEYASRVFEATNGVPLETVQALAASAADPSLRQAQAKRLEDFNAEFDRIPVRDWPVLEGGN